jgi:hypothetical protein
MWVRKRQSTTLSLVSSVVAMMRRVSDEAPILQVVILDDSDEHIAQRTSIKHAHMDPHDPYSGWVGSIDLADDDDDDGSTDDGSRRDSLGSFGCWGNFARNGVASGMGQDRVSWAENPALSWDGRKDIHENGYGH